MKKSLVFALMFLSFSVFAQKENYNWNFGNHAGLTWNTTQTYHAGDIFEISGGDILLDDVPTSFQSAINTQEGCFSVSSDEGALLFYSDGVKIWNKNHQLMPNGSGLTGSSTSTQSGIIIPRPGYGGQYIAVCLGNEQSNVMTYSIIDMSLDGGLGDVVSGFKDLPFKGQTGNLGETVTAVRHSNKSDFWVVAVGRNTTDTWLNVWLIDKDSVHTVAKSALTVALNKVAGQYMSGYFVFNKQGTSFWYNSWSPPSGHSAFHAFGTFNPATGQFSNIKIRNTGDATAATRALYGAAFSPSGQYVYSTIINGEKNSTGKSTLEVYDYNELTAAADPSTVSPKNTVVSPSTSLAQDGTNNHFGAVGLGPGNRIYIADAFGKGLFVVPDPDDDPTDLKIYKLDTLLKYSTVGSGGWGLPSSTGFYFNIQLNPQSEHSPICSLQDSVFILSISGGEGGDDLAKIWIKWGDSSPISIIDTPIVNHTYRLIHKYQRGEYTITITSYNSLGGKISALSSTQKIRVNSCRLIANRNIRGRLYRLYYD
ncbi:MAG: hypothetical protein LBR13_06905 [Dysgonamonadaceae bacterium]|jgi:hypothetical protein|nr:hypothetical protein [Dysgonamonadaceae bacterium]